MKMGTVDDTIADIVRAVEEYGKITDVSVVSSLLERYAKTTSQNGRLFLLRRMISTVDSLQRRFPVGLTVPAAAENIIEGISVGKVIPGGTEFKLSSTNLNRNILVTASVGHGKTSLVYNILRKLGDKKLTYILFDLKRDYRVLAYDENTFYFDDKNLRINPLEPPQNVSRREWAVHFADAFSHSFALLIGSRDFLLENVLELYEKWEDRETPSLTDLLLQLETTKVRNEYLKVVKGRIKALISSTDVFSDRGGISIQELDKNNLIFGIDNLGFAEQGFIVSVILSHLFYMNLSQPEKRGNFYKVVCIDDAHTILDVRKEKDYALGIPLLHQIISKMRELGVGFIFSDQQASSLLSSVIQNSNTKFIGRINLAEDLPRIFGNRITPETEAAVQNLGVGEFLVLCSDFSPYCIVKADLISIEKDVDRDLIGLKSRKLEKSLSTKSNTPVKNKISHMKERVISCLFECGINFDDDGFGILINSTKKVYITFMASTEDLLRLMETSFDSVIDLVEESADKEEIIRKLKSSGSLKPFLNLESLKIYSTEDFIFSKRKILK